MRIKERRAEKSDVFVVFAVSCFAKKQGGFILSCIDKKEQIKRKFKAALSLLH